MKAEIILDTEGLSRYAVPQKQWMVEQGSDPLFAQYAIFAGHKLSVVARSEQLGGGFGQHYLGHTRFCKTMEDGKSTAIDFAQEVLRKMMSDVGES